MTSHAEAVALQQSLKRWTDQHKPAIMWAGVNALHLPTAPSRAATHALVLTLSHRGNETFDVEAGGVETLEALRAASPLLRDANLPREVGGRPVLFIILTCNQVVNACPVQVMDDLDRVQVDEDWLGGLRYLIENP